MYDKRPSEKELLKRIQDAKVALQASMGVFANPAKAVGELYALVIGDSEEIWKLIRELLEEITPQDYTGSKPPQKSYEKTIIGNELFAFSWWSKKLGKKMYLKFALKNGRYYYVSLHACRFSEQEGVL